MEKKTNAASYTNKTNTRNRRNTILNVLIFWKALIAESYISLSLKLVSFDHLWATRNASFSYDFRLNNVNQKFLAFHEFNTKLFDQ